MKHPVPVRVVCAFVTASLFAPACGAWSESQGVPEFARDGLSSAAGEEDRAELREALTMLRERARTGDAPARERGTDALNMQPPLPVEVVRPARAPALDEEGRLLRSAVLRVLNQGAHTFIGNVRLEPAYDGGSLIGYTLADYTRDAAWLEDAGLRRGDVIRRVNGRSIHAPDVFMEVWDGLRERSRIAVDVVRDREETLFEWDIVDDTTASSQP